MTNGQSSGRRLMWIFRALEKQTSFARRSLLAVIGWTVSDERSQATSKAVECLGCVCAAGNWIRISLTLRWKVLFTLIILIFKPLKCRPLCNCSVASEDLQWRLFTDSALLPSIPDSPLLWAFSGSETEFICNPTFARQKIRMPEIITILRSAQSRYCVSIPRRIGSSVNGPRHSGQTQHEIENAYQNT